MHATNQRPQLSKTLAGILRACLLERFARRFQLHVGSVKPGEIYGRRNNEQPSSTCWHVAARRASARKLIIYVSAWATEARCAGNASRQSRVAGLARAATCSHLAADFSSSCRRV